MLLGGSTQQIPAIQYAKKHGYYTILCDYLSDNPGQHYADEFHCISTTDKEAILKIAKRKKIDGIVAYASDPAAPTAAYVGNQLGLPSNPYDSVLILSKKDLFRKFLSENKFNCPRAESFKNFEEAKKNLHKFHYPVMVKPTDSSGSKGVSCINSEEEFKNAFEHAMFNSREEVVIVEEYIEMTHDYMIGGDVFVIDGKLEFCGFLNCHRSKQVNPYVPIGKSFPLLIKEEQLNIVRTELQRVIDILDIKMGALNIEVMFGKDDKLYIIEMGPRNGGNMIPNLLKMITEVDLVKTTIEVALGNHNVNIQHDHREVFYSTYVLHSPNKGKLKDIIIKDDINNNILHKVIYKEKGSEIDTFNGADKALGIIFLKFNSLEEQKMKMTEMDRYIDIQLV